LLVKYGNLSPLSHDEPAAIQRLVEGQHLDQRLFLHGYDVPVEGQRHRIHSHRQAILEGTIPCQSELERLITLRTIDDLWADYLARVAELRAGVHWQSYASSPPLFLSLNHRDPHSAFLGQIHEWFQELEAALPSEIARRVLEAEAIGGEDTGERGAVWTYLTTDQPFGGWTKKVLDGLQRKVQRRALLG